MFSSHRANNRKTSRIVLLFIAVAAILSPASILVARAVAGGPNLSVEALSADDTTSEESVGDGDGRVECGETVELDFTLINNGDATATSVVNALSSTDPYISFPANTSSTYADIAPSAQVINDNDYEVTIDTDTPDGHEAQFSYQITAANDGPWTDTFTIIINCSAQPDSYEPDNNKVDATTLIPDTPQTHTIVPVDDQDWLTFSLDMSTGITLNISDSVGDPRMWLYDANLTEIEYNDDNKSGYLPYIDRICDSDPLPAGTYYVKIDEYNNNATIESYDITLTSSACPVGTFNDVPSYHWAFEYVEALADAEVTGGCGDGNYCPDDPVTRAQMAVFLERAKRGSSFFPDPATGVFADVPTSYWAAAWIEQLANDEVTSGCGGANYCPEQAVTRAQMAVFLERADRGSTFVPPDATGMFTDVPTSHWAASWIEQLASDGITSGCGGGNYCPEQAVTRAQMAVFLTKAFDLPIPTF